MKIEYAYGLSPGDRVVIELSPSRHLEATVEWSVATYCGIEFSQPLAEDDPVLISREIH